MAQACSFTRLCPIRSQQPAEESGLSLSPKYTPVYGALALASNSLLFYITMNDRWLCGPSWWEAEKQGSLGGDAWRSVASRPHTGLQQATHRGDEAVPGRDEGCTSGLHGRDVALNATEALRQKT